MFVFYAWAVPCSFPPTHPRFVRGIYVKDCVGNGNKARAHEYEQKDGRITACTSILVLLLLLAASAAAAATAAAAAATAAAAGTVVAAAAAGCFCCCCYQPHDYYDDGLLGA